MNEKVIWDHSMLMEEACDRANKQLTEMFPDKELVYEDHDGMTRYKEYYQDIFNGMYDDIEAQLPLELSKIEENWLETYDESGVIYKMFSDFDFMFECEGKVHRINAESLTIKEVEEGLVYSGYSLWDGSIELDPFVFALYRYLYLIDINNERTR